MNRTRNNLSDIQDYIAEAIRELKPEYVNAPGYGFAFAVNSILASALKLPPPQSAREKMSERQKLRWQSERAKKDEIEKREAERKERKREARKAKKAEAEK